MEKFVNPKKLKGQDKLERIKDLMGKMNTITESKTLSELELIKKGPNGIVYGIIRENRNYFIKTTEKTSGTFLAEDFNYVGGVKNKFDERYNSYAESIKHLNMKFDMLNESFGIEENNSIFESDGVPIGNASGIAKGFGFVTEEEDDPDHPGESCDQAHPDASHDEYKGPQIISDEEDVEEQKKVIRVDAPAPPPVEDEVEVDEVEVDEFGDDEDEFGDDEEIEGEEGDEYTKKIQKLTGKVTQLMRDMDDPDPELDKYVINSVISAVDFEEMDDEDVEDIIAKIEGEDEEEGEEFGAEEEGEELGAEEEGEEFGAEEELAEGEDKEDKEDEDKVSWKDLRNKMYKYERELSSKEKEDYIKKLKSNIQELQSDVDIGKKEKNESKTFTKKQLMETFLNKNVKNSLKKVLKENNRICEECMGGGCPSCEGDSHSVKNNGDWASLTEYSDKDMLAGDDIGVMEQEMDVTAAIATGQDYLRATGDLDRDGDDIPNRLDLDNNDDGSLDYGIGNKMYDWPEHILGKKGDRDSDGIPNKYDSDVDGDGVDDDFIEIDIDSIMGNVPIKEPDVAPPKTTPGTKPGKPRWKKIPRPNVDPRPKGERRRASLQRRGIYR